MTHTVASLDPRRGGPSRSVPALAAALREQGVQADVHAWDALEWQTVEGRALIHDHGIWLLSNHRTARIARHAGLPRVVSVRGMLEPWALNHHPWRKRLAWQLYQRRDLQAAAVIHATSGAEAGAVRRLGLTNPLAVIPNGVEIPNQLPPRTITPRRRALFLSRIHPIKGIPMLIEAWECIRPRDWELVIAGPDEGGYRAELATMIREASLGQDVRLHEAVSDEEKWGLYRSADLFVLPTHSENFGLVVAEALAAEVPVITTKGAPWQDLESHRCGWWTDASTEALADALRKAIALSDDERRTMGSRGRRLVEEKYSWQRAATEMCEVYEWVLRGGEAPACLFKG